MEQPPAAVWSRLSIQSVLQRPAKFCQERKGRNWASNHRSSSRYFFSFSTAIFLIDIAFFLSPISANVCSYPSGWNTQSHWKSRFPLGGNTICPEISPSKVLICFPLQYAMDLPPKGNAYRRVFDYWWVLYWRKPRTMRPGFHKSYYLFSLLIWFSKLVKNRLSPTKRNCFSPVSGFLSYRIIP